MTLDRVIVDLSRAFEPSQIYVARKFPYSHNSMQSAKTLEVSRARSLKGLKVIALPKRPMGGANPQVKEFCATYLSKR